MGLNLMNIESYYDLDFKEKLEVTISLSRPKKFFETFFNNLPFSKTQTDCFNKLNDLHFDIYAEYKYSSYNSFIKTYKKHLIKEKK